MSHSLHIPPVYVTVQQAMTQYTAGQLNSSHSTLGAAQPTHALTQHRTEQNSAQQTMTSTPHHHSTTHSTAWHSIPQHSTPVGPAIQQYALQGHGGGLQQGAGQVGGQGLAGSSDHVLQGSIQLQQHRVQARPLHMVLVQLLQHRPPQVKEHCLQSAGRDSWC